MRYHLVKKHKNLPMIQVLVSKHKKLETALSKAPGPMLKCVHPDIDWYIVDTETNLTINI